MGAVCDIQTFVITLADFNDASIKVKQKASHVVHSVLPMVLVQDMRMYWQMLKPLSIVQCVGMEIDETRQKLQ